MNGRRWARQAGGNASNWASSDAAGVADVGDGDDVSAAVAAGEVAAAAVSSPNKEPCCDEERERVAEVMAEECRS
jgi:hypothetical protein